MRQRFAGAAALVATALLALPAGAAAHGAVSEQYEATIFGMKPAGQPVDVRVEDGDQLRIENVGDEELLLCGYGGGDAEVDGCEPYVRLGPDGVFVNHNSRSYYANLDEEQYGDVPDDAGEGEPDWQRLRGEPAFFSYHDHRIHWMGGDDTLPPGADSSKPGKQKVNDFTIDFRYGDTPVEINGRLDYVGGQTFFQRWFEYGLTGGAILLMLLVFGFDARRRRRARSTGGDGDGDPKPPRGGDRSQPTTTVLAREGDELDATPAGGR